jgi:hypothetical protein
MIAPRGHVAGRQHRVDGRRCPSGCPSFIAMMQSAYFRERDDASFRRHLNASCRRRVLFQGEMCSRPMIIGEIRDQETPQVPLAEDDHVVQTLGAPRLRRWPTASSQKSRHAALRHGDAQLAQFPVDARGSPERIRLGHLGRSEECERGQRLSRFESARCPENTAKRTTHHPRFTRQYPPSTTNGLDHRRRLRVVAGIQVVLPAGARRERRPLIDAQRALIVG